MSLLTNVARSMADVRTAVSARGGQAGQVLVLFGLALFVLFGAVGLGVDGSRLLEERRQAQAAADHAATAAAFKRCSDRRSDETTARQAGLNSASANGFAHDPPTVVVTLDVVRDTDDIKEWRAVVTSRVHGTFSRALGFDTFDVTAEATARGSGCGSGGGGIGAAMWGGGNTCLPGSLSLSRVPGSDNTVNGTIYSNGNVSISGGTNRFLGTLDANNVRGPAIRYGSSFSNGGSGNTFEAAQQLITPPPIGPSWPSGWESSLADETTDQLYVNYKALAVNQTSLSQQDIFLAGNGVYYTDNPNGMVVKFTGPVSTPRKVVLVSANGPIQMSESNVNLTALTLADDSRLPRDNLLAVAQRPPDGTQPCDSFAIKMEGSNNQWTGYVWGPNGLIEIGGSTNTFNGSVIGWSVSLNGSRITINGTSWPTTGTPSYTLEQ